MAKHSELVQVKDRRKLLFCIIDASIMEDETLSAYDKIVYIALCTFMSAGDVTCSPAVKDIAKKASCCERQVRRSIQTLMKKDFIERNEQKSEYGGTLANTYILRSSEL